jgi:probable HAF family extracellular repeat protein
VEAHGVNDHRHVVGGYVPPNSVWHRGFWWSNGGWSTLDAPWAGRKATIAHAITNNQKITGIWVDAADNTRGFIRTNGSTYTMLDVPGARWTVPLDINEAGQVVGWYRGWDDSVGAFLYTNGQWYTVMVTEPNVTFTHIEGLNNHTHLAGRLRIWQPGQTEEFISKGLVLLASPELQAEAPPMQVASQARMSFAAADASTVPVYIPDWPKDYRPGKGKPLPW